MKIVLVFILALGVFSKYITYEDSDSFEDFSDSADIDDVPSLIVNGTQAIEGQFPYQAGLLKKHTGGKFTWCSGSLIGHNWIITAAHCLRNVVSVKVYLGSIKRRSGKIIRTVGASCTHPHRDYGVNRIANDIALIYIPYVSYTDNIQPITLPSIVPPYSDYSGSIVVISGWGQTSNSSKSLPKYLRYAHVPVMHNSDCEYKIFHSNICVNASNSGTCSGDSGSPVALVSNGLLVGVHSSGIGKCVVGRSRISVRVTSFLEWIKNKTGIFY